MIQVQLTLGNLPSGGSEVGMLSECSQHPCEKTDDVFFFKKSEGMLRRFCDLPRVLPGSSYTFPDPPLVRIESLLPLNSYKILHVVLFDIFAILSCVTLFLSISLTRLLIFLVCDVRSQTPHHFLLDVSHPPRRPACITPVEIMILCFLD